MGNYQNFLVSVSLDISGSEPAFTFSSDPIVSTGAMATIIWVVDSEGEPFTFRKFKWCNEEHFLSSHIIEDEAIVVLVSNHSNADAGNWAYRIRVKSHSGKRIWSPACSNDANEGVQPGDLVALGNRPVIVNAGGGPEGNPHA